jgi:ribonuclease G
MIVLDFIDMNDPKDRQKVISALEKELQKDREKAKICHISPLGLVEMTRKRTGETVTEATTCVCPHCQGRGRVESAETVSIRIERDLRRLASERDDEAFLVIANPEVVFYLVGDNGETVSDIERIIDRVVYVRADEELFIEKYQILPADAAQMQEQVSGIQPGATINLEVVPAPFSSAPKAYGWADGYLVELSNGASSEGEHVNVRVDQVTRSLASAAVIE